MLRALAEDPPAAQFTSGIQLDPAGHVGDLQGGLAEPALHRVGHSDVGGGCAVKALPGEGVRQRAQRADGAQLGAGAIDGAGEAFRAPARGESVRVAPGTLEEPSTGAQPPGGVLEVRGLGYIDFAHCCQSGQRVSTRHHRRVNTLLSVLPKRARSSEPWATPPAAAARSPRRARSGGAAACSDRPRWPSAASARGRRPSASHRRNHSPRPTRAAGRG